MGSELFRSLDMALFEAAVLVSGERNVHSDAGHILVDGILGQDDIEEKLRGQAETYRRKNESKANGGLEETLRTVRVMRNLGYEEHRPSEDQQSLYGARRKAREMLVFGFVRVWFCGARIRASQARKRLAEYGKCISSCTDGRSCIIRPVEPNLHPSQKGASTAALSETNASEETRAEDCSAQPEILQLVLSRGADGNTFTTVDAQSAESVAGASAARTQSEGGRKA
ncbi:hypothetical protein FB451DRAFT_1173400 [Mycena latifolia]|nr:hypothetical protein FB451DRAFT_1173400 [Mycena latifolia]